MSKIDLSPIILQDSKGRILAKALYKKKPSPRCPNPYWKMKISGQKGTINLGRLSRDKVLPKMKQILSKKQIKKGTVEYLLRGFFNYKKNGDWGESTATGHKNDIKRIVPIIGQVMLPKLQQRHLDLLKTKLLKHPYSKRTINKTLGFLSSAIKWGRMKGITIPHLELKRLSLKKGEYVNNHYTPTKEEIEQVFWAIEDETFQKMFFLWWILGSRSSEVLNISWEEIVYDEKHEFYIAPLNGKTGERNGYLHPNEFNLLKDLSSEHTGLLFADLSTNGASKRIKDICQKMGVPEFTPHGLRRAAANNLFGKVSNRVYTEIMGHSIQTFWKCYKDVNEDEKMEALRTIERPISIFGRYYASSKPLQTPTTSTEASKTPIWHTIHSEGW